MASQPPFVPRAAIDPGALGLRRNKRHEFFIWWREIDRMLLTLVLALMAIGAAAVAAASPASSRRLHVDDMHFFVLHLRYMLIGLAAMFWASTLPKETARRFGILLGIGMLFALILVPVIGTNVNGSKRWLNLGISFQPSEFLKPAFAICLAWIFTWRARDPEMPVVAITGALMVVVAALLMLQPDFGSTVLFAGVWFVLVFLSGVPMKRIGILVGAGIAGVVATYFLYDNARHRIDNFLGGGSAYDQVDLAHRTITAGGWSGTGLWLGMRKLSLPEAHTDYIFSVIGEEFGLIVCMVIVLLYVGIIARVLYRLMKEEDLFTVLAATGLTAQLGGQAFINILVNLRLFPSKGMTLPLISYGGSSTIALCLGVGLLLAVTRRNPYLERDPFALRQSGAKA